MKTHREILPGIHWIQECGGHNAGIARAMVEEKAVSYTHLTLPTNREV